MGQIGKGILSDGWFKPILKTLNRDIPGFVYQDVCSFRCRKFSRNKFNSECSRIHGKYCVSAQFKQRNHLGFSRVFTRVFIDVVPAFLFAKQANAEQFVLLSNLVGLLELPIQQ